MSDGFFEQMSPERQARYLAEIRANAEAMSGLKTYNHEDGMIRFGKGDECKSIPEMEAYQNKVLTRKRKRVFDNHFDECKDCKSALDFIVDEIAPQYSKNPVAVMFRKTSALYHYLEYLYQERNTE